MTKLKAQQSKANKMAMNRISTLRNYAKIEKRYYSKTRPNMKAGSLKEKIFLRRHRTQY
jgi:hypothetical protein